MATSTHSLPLTSIIRNTDVILAAGVIGMLLIMVVPLPQIVLDLLLALSISIAVLILFVALFTASSLEFSSFPTVLLISTIFRLSLNIASTRLILLEGHQGPHAAGAIIKSFGEFVVGGNIIVGIIVFLILVIINFVVITKGTGRIAEVAARFTLDAMPGKQMAIDADLNAGLIDEQEAKDRRKKIQRESDYFGALDGASKFVRGDAIAGVIITSINLLGGLLIGTTQYDMSAGQVDGGDRGWSCRADSRADHLDCGRYCRHQGFFRKPHFGGLAAPSVQQHAGAVFRLCGAAALGVDSGAADRSVPAALHPHLLPCSSLPEGTGAASI